MDERTLFSQDQPSERNPTESCQPPDFPAVGRGYALVLKGRSAKLTTISTTWILLILVTEVTRRLETSLRYMLSRFL